MGSKLKLTGILGVVILVVDQWTKNIVHNRFHWGESIELIPGFFNLTYVRNKGAAFGFMNTAPEWIREPFFMIVPLLALAAVSFFLWKTPNHQKRALVSWVLVFWGAIGNLIDRIRFGYVVDFLDFHWKEVYHYPAFNVADSCIVVGVGFLLLESLREHRTSPAK